MSSAHTLEEVRLTEMETFFGVSEACAKSPTEAEVLETPIVQQLLALSQQDMAKHKLNDTWLEHCHLCALTTLVLLLVRPSTDLFLAVPPLLLCYCAMNWLALLHYGLETSRDV